MRWTEKLLLLEAEHALVVLDHELLAGPHVTRGHGAVRGVVTARVVT
jgi:hypothetical protein